MYCSCYMYSTKTSGQRVGREEVSAATTDELADGVVLGADVGRVIGSHAERELGRVGARVVLEVLRALVGAGPRAGVTGPRGCRRRPHLHRLHLVLARGVVGVGPRAHVPLRLVRPQPAADKHLYTRPARKLSSVLFSL